MGERYAVHFQVEPTGAKGRDLLDRVAEDCTEWLRTNSGKPPAGEHAGIWNLSDDADAGSVLVQQKEDDNDALYSFAWTVRRADVTWTADLQLSTTGEHVDLSGSVRTDQAGGAEGFDRRIGVVADLIDRYDCRRAGAQLHTTARNVTVPVIDAFIKNWLVNPKRELPIIAVSAASGQKPAIDADAMQKQLAGVARVFRLESASSIGLTESLGRSLSCYGGAVRIYRPGFATGDSSRQHPFWLSNALRRKNIFADIAAHAGPMSTPSFRATAFLDVQEGIRQRGLDRLRAADRPSSNENQVLQQQIERERHWREEAIKERERYQSLYEQAQRELDQQRSDQELARDDEEIIVESVVEAVQAADMRRSESLAFLPSAFSSAEQSRYSQPTLVLEALAELDRLSQELNSGLAKPEQIVQELNERRFECSTESVDTMNRYGDQRRFRDETGQLIEMSPHIKFGSGRGADKRLRIHFVWADDYRQILVGHVGRHLRTGRS
jgi:hypothetical protein